MFWYIDIISSDDMFSLSGDIINTTSITASEEPASGKSNSKLNVWLY